LDITIVYCTDNNIDGVIANVCQQQLKKAANGFSIISVSHKPIDFGKNICIGKQKRSWLTLYKQIHEGLKLVETEYVAIAEHDCLYTEEHFNWKPQRSDTFYYNENVWFLEWRDKHPELKGVFSKWPHRRLALSQLICNTELYREATRRRLDILDKKRFSAKQIAHISEPGLTKIAQKAQKWADSGRAVYLKQYLEKFIDPEKLETFETIKPNVDIRHNHNFTGPRRGRNRTFELKPWGKFENIKELNYGLSI